MQFGHAASIILPCSQPALLLVIRGNMAKCIFAGSVNTFEHLDVLWEPHSLFSCFDTAPDLL